MRRTCALSIVAAAFSIFAAGGAARAEEGDARPAYKEGASWPLRNFNGFDFAEPFFPRAAAHNGDWGRIAVDTIAPYATLAGALIDYRRVDEETFREIGSWRWVGVDEHDDNVPFLAGMIALSWLSVLMPAPVEDAGGYSWDLRLDRATVLALGYLVTEAETEILKRTLAHPRPNNIANTESRPSGHASACAVGAAFMSDVLRDTLRPQDEANVPLRIVEEVATFIPYLGAAYMSLERVHAKKHFLTDTLLGDALGVFNMNLFYAWSFTRTEEGRGWLDVASLGYDRETGGMAVMFGKRF